MEQRVTNFDKVVEFALDGTVFRRRLVHEVEDVSDLNVDSPVGQALVGALPEERFTVKAPGGPVSVQMIGVVE